MKVIKRAINVSLALTLFSTAVLAQSITDAKKAADAEQYQKAKTILNGLITAKPADGEPYFYLGEVYLKTDYADSAKIYFSKGAAADADFPLNHIGLGAVDLESGNTTAATANFDKAASLAKKKDSKPFIAIAEAYIHAPKPDYNAAIANLDKAKSANPKDAEVLLVYGDAYRGLSKWSEAYTAYSDAYAMDKNLLRAKVEIGVSNRWSKAFPESVEEINKALAIDPNYGPAHRELAETYNVWAATEPKSHDEKIKQSLQAYEKYMDLTDRSLDSRMRHADFLIKAKEYKAVQAEAEAMSKVANTNPRILRYLGIGAYENADYEKSIQAFKDFQAKAEPSRIIPLDYLYLGRAQIKAGQDSLGILNLSKAIELDSTNADVMPDIAKAYFTGKQYDKAATAYELALKDPKLTTRLTTTVYVGLSYYFDYVTTSDTTVQKSKKDLLVKADSAFSQVAQQAEGGYPDGYYYRGVIAQLKGDPSSKADMATQWEKYLEVVTKEKPETLTDPKSKAKLINIYNFLGAFYAETDADKAKDYFTKTLALDPVNQYATDTMKVLASTK